MSPLRSLRLTPILGVLALTPATADEKPVLTRVDTSGAWVAPVNVPEAVARRALEVRNQPLPERIDAISELMLGLPYADGPTGEAAAPDPDPLVRYDVFDCLTFVEEVLALSLAGDPYHAAELRNAFRYGAGAEVDYARRRHFMELQWLPGAVADGLLRQTSREYGETIRGDREITAETWRAWRKTDTFHMSPSQLPAGRFDLDILPLDTAIAQADRIRPGSLIMIVRDDYEHIPLRITHLSMVLPGSPRMIRHATRMTSSMKVRDHELRYYLNLLKTYSNWPVTGIAVFEPLEQGPRLSRLPG